MKKIIIVLVVIMMFSIFLPSLAKTETEFGGWKYWDKELPASTNESWYWATSANKPSRFVVKDIVIFTSDIYFRGGNEWASAVFYSWGPDLDTGSWDIPDAQLAIIAFPPKKGKMSIKVYHQESHDGIFRHLEEWKIPFRDAIEVVPKGTQRTQIQKILVDWLTSRLTSNGIDNTVGEVVAKLLPVLRIYEKGFLIQPAFEIL